MTPRGWWTLFTVGLMLLLGVANAVSPLVITALTLLLWFGWEWLSFRSVSAPFDNGLLSSAKCATTAVRFPRCGPVDSSGYGCR